MQRILESHHAQKKKNSLFEIFKTAASNEEKQIKREEGRGGKVRINTVASGKN